MGTRSSTVAWGVPASAGEFPGIGQTCPAGGSAPATDCDIAVSIEPASPAERADLFARAHTLSSRETDLLLLLLEGADTRTVAARLFLSEHTVQDHLKSVFAKTGTHTRRVLLARVTGH